jgi:hypothetical protein
LAQSAKNRAFRYNNAAWRCAPGGVIPLQSLARLRDGAAIGRAAFSQLSQRYFRNCKKIKCTAFYFNCLCNKEITGPFGHVISLQFLNANVNEVEWQLC